MAYGTLGYGLLTGAFTPETTFVDWDWRSSGTAFGLPLFRREQFLKELRVVERLKALAASYAKSVAQLAIAWVLGHSEVTVALVGMRNTRELEENVAAVDWKLTAEDRAEIDRIFQEEDVPTHRETAQAVCTETLWWLDLFGPTLFMGALKMIIAPLILASIVSGVTSLPDMKELGAIGWKTMAYYICTTTLAVIIGLVAVLITQPGKRSATAEVRPLRVEVIT